MFLINSIILQKMFFISSIPHFLYKFSQNIFVVEKKTLFSPLKLFINQDLFFMKKKRFIFLLLLLGVTIWVAQAQTQQTYVKVEYIDNGTVKTDDFSLVGGKVQIKNNQVLVLFAENPALNKTYLFDNINSMFFEQRNVGVDENSATEDFKVYLDGSGILNITATQPVGKVSVYSVTGALVAGTDTHAPTAQINLSALPKGAYFVQAGNNIVKIIK